VVSGGQRGVGAVAQVGADRPDRRISQDLWIGVSRGLLTSF